MKIFNIIIGALLLLFGEMMPNEVTKNLLITQNSDQQIDSCILYHKDSSTINQNYEGIWGDFSYLNILRKCNSVSKADSLFGNRIIQLQIEDGNMYISDPYSQENCLIEQDVYDVQIIDNEELFLVNNKTGERQLMQKIIYDKNMYHYYDVFDFALNKMRFMWFGGSYDVFDKDNKIKNIYFDENGNVNGYEKFVSYGFGTDIKGQDFIYFLEEDKSISNKYFLIDYICGKYYLYNVSGFEDVDIPFIKNDLQMMLNKID